jgi:hypothetical protein
MARCGRWSVLGGGGSSSGPGTGAAAEPRGVSTEEADRLPLRPDSGSQTEWHHDRPCRSRRHAGRCEWQVSGLESSGRWQARVSERPQLTSANCHRRKESLHRFFETRTSAYDALQSALSACRRRVEGALLHARAALPEAEMDEHARMLWWAEFAESSEREQLDASRQGIDLYGHA